MQHIYRSEFHFVDAVSFYMLTKHRYIIMYVNIVKQIDVCLLKLNANVMIQLFKLIERNKCYSLYILMLSF